MEKLDRITQDPHVTVGMIVRKIGAGQTPEELLQEYPYFEADDVKQALQFKPA